MARMMSVNCWEVKAIVTTPAERSHPHIVNVAIEVVDSSACITENLLEKARQAAEEHVKRVVDGAKDVGVTWVGVMSMIHRGETWVG